MLHTVEENPPGYSEDVEIDHPMMDLDGDSLQSLYPQMTMKILKEARDVQSGGRERDGPNLRALNWRSRHLLLRLLDDDFQMAIILICECFSFWRTGKPDEENFGKVLTYCQGC